MQNAQEFLISELTKTKDSYEVIESKSGVSKTTIHRMMTGQVVSASSMRAIATAYGLLDEFLALQSAAADPKRAAHELHEMYHHAEQLLVDNCEERIAFMKQRIETLERSHEKEISALLAAHEKEIAIIEKAHEEVILAHSEAAKGWHKRANTFTLLFGLTIAVCVLMVLLLAYYLHYDITHLDMGMFRGLMMDNSGSEFGNAIIIASHVHSTGTPVPTSSFLQLFA